MHVPSENIWLPDIVLYNKYAAHLCNYLGPTCLANERPPSRNNPDNLLLNSSGRNFCHQPPADELPVDYAIHSGPPSMNRDSGANRSPTT